MFENPAKAYERSNSLRESPLKKDEEDLLNFLDKKGISNYFKNIDKFEEIYGNNKASEKLFRRMSKSDRYNYNSFEIGDIIKEDKERIKKQQTRASEMEHTERARLLENILFNPHIKNSAIESAWFGDDAMATPTTEFDDRFNGVDAVVQWGVGNDSPKLAVDCTVSGREDVLEKKKDKLLEGIKDSNLGEVKYFQCSEDLEDPAEAEDFGPLIRVPQVVLSVNKDILEELSQEIMRGGDFSQHHLQFNLLEESRQQLMQQLSIIEEYADNPTELKKLNWSQEEKENFLNNSSEMKNNINNTIEKLDKVIKEKESSLPKRKQRAGRKKEDNIVPISFDTVD